MPRFHCPIDLHPGELLSLPSSAVRHVQVLRLQPGDEVTLFGAWSDRPGTGEAGAGNLEYQAIVQTMGRDQVLVRVGPRRAVSREPTLSVHLVFGVPSADRMDWLVEKAVELGVASIQPLITERSVLRLQGERAQKKLRHWQAIAVAACEQSGRNTVPPLHEICDFGTWMQGLASAEAARPRWLLSPLAPEASLRKEELGLEQSGMSSLLALSGPEGGLTPREELACQQAGFATVSLGPRVLRADTAPLALLARLTLGR